MIQEVGRYHNCSYSRNIGRSLVVAIRGCLLMIGVSTITFADPWYTNGVIYEVNPLAMTDSGRLSEVTERLPEIESLGVSTLYLLPVFEHEPVLTYRILDYYKIAERFGGEQELREFVDKAHALGMRVLLDLVIAHSPAGLEVIKWPAPVDELFSGGKGPMARLYAEGQESVAIRLADLKESDRPAYEEALRTNVLHSNSPLGELHPHWFLRDKLGKPVLTHPNPGWGLAFDYGNEEVQQYFADIAAYYVREFGIDGWRVDAPQNNFDSDRFPNAVNSIALLRAVRQAIRKEKSDAILFGENVSDHVEYLDEGEPVFDEVFDISYGHWLYWDLKRRAGEPEGLETFSSQDLVDLLAKNAPTNGRYRANHLGTHDTERVRGAFPQTWKALTVIQYTVPGVPMIYGGAEIGETDRLYTDWAKGDDAVREFHEALQEIRLHESTANGTFAPILLDRPGVCAFVRRAENATLVVIANLRKFAADISLNIDEAISPNVNSGKFRIQDLLDEKRSEREMSRDRAIDLVIRPGEAHVLSIEPL